MSASRISAALDRRREPRRQAPAPRQDAAHESVVDAELAPLAVDALLGRLRLAVHLAGIARVRVRQDELADVVQERRDEQLVAVLVLGLLGQPVGRALRGHGVQAEPLRCRIPTRDALEEVEGVGARREGLDARRREHLDGLRHARDLGLLGGGRPVRDAEHRDDERDVRLDGRDDVAGGGVLLAHEPEHAVARLGERGEQLERLESGREATSMSLVLPGPGGGGALLRAIRDGLQCWVQSVFGVGRVAACILATP
jgi:hypothetical protein